MAEGCQDKWASFGAHVAEGHPLRGDFGCAWFCLSHRARCDALRVTVDVKIGLGPGGLGPQTFAPPPPKQGSLF